MPLFAIIFVTIGAVLFSLYNVLTKDVQNRGGLVEFSATLVFLHAGGAALVLFFISVFTGGPQMQPGFFIPMLITGFLNIGILFGKMRARALEDVSLVTPINSVSPAAVLIASMLILGEQPTLIGIIGIILIAGGTYVLNIEDMRTRLTNLANKRKYLGIGFFRKWLGIWGAPFMALKNSSGVRWALFSMILASISINFDGLVARHSNIAFALGCVLAITACGNLVIAVFNKEFQKVNFKNLFSPTTLSQTMLLIFLYAGGNFITNFAYRYSIVPYVGAMKRLVIPMTIFLAWAILGEKKSFGDRLLGGMIMALGTVLIAFSGE